MAQDTKKLGELLVEAGLITAAQLQEALRHQRIAGGRMGSNLVALGFVSEDILMDFLAQQTGVPRVDLRNVEVPPDVLRRIPRRLADQLNVLPIAVKEPKSLVLAMADPLDLNAIDSSRFASGLNIEPVVVSISQLKQFIPDLYRKVDGAGTGPIDVGLAHGPHPEVLPVPFEVPSIPLNPAQSTVPGAPKYSSDPFFDETAKEEQPQNPFNFFASDAVETLESPVPPAQMVAAQPMVIHARTGQGQQSRRLETFQTRTLVMGLIKMLQRRGILGDDELQRFIANLIEAGDLREEAKGTSGSAEGSGLSGGVL